MLDLADCFPKMYEMFTVLPQKFGYCNLYLNSIGRVICCGAAGLCLCLVGLHLFDEIRNRKCSKHTSQLATTEREQCQSRKIISNNSHEHYTTLTTMRIGKDVEQLTSDFKKLIVLVH